MRVISAVKLSCLNRLLFVISDSVNFVINTLRNMKNIIKILSILAVITAIYFSFTNNARADKACDAFIIITNNSLFEITLTVDGMPSGYLLVGKTKTYTVILGNDTPKRIKVKAEYLDPDYIEPKALNYVTKNKVECGMTDTLYVAFTK